MARAVLVLLGLLAAFAAARPEKFMLENVPYMRQTTDFFCGDASLAMGLGYFNGWALDQYAMADVCRTVPYTGTTTFDIVRGAHFSHKSSAPANGLFPDSAPRRGWGSEDELRFGTQVYDCSLDNYNGNATKDKRDACWIDGIKDAIAAGFPVVVLVGYRTDDLVDGHFNLAVGYDKDHLTLYDPWDRYEWWFTDPPRPSIMTYTNEDFCTLWSYAENAGNSWIKRNFWGAILAPWSLKATLGRDANMASDIFKITAKIGYTRPPLPSGHGVTCRHYPVTKQHADIDFPSTLGLDPATQGQKKGHDLTLAEGASTTLTWVVKDYGMNVTVSKMREVEVTVTGHVHGEVHPYSDRWPQGYTYEDELGRVVSVRTPGLHKTHHQAVCAF